MTETITAKTTDSTQAKTEAFTFGDPVPVLDGHDLADYLECYWNGQYYEPQVNLIGLAKSYRSNPYLSSGIIFKRNFLANLFKPHPLLSRKAFEQISLDFIWSGNAYLQQVKNRLGGVLQYQPSLAKYTRVSNNNTFYFLNCNYDGESDYIFPANTICHIRETDIDQEIYGSPEYLSTLQSAWLNESATLFRRKYYNNGSHAGFIMYVTDPANDPNDIAALRKAMKDSKGPGNFRNLFYYAPNGKKDGLQIMPISEIAAKDDFASIKGITRDDILASLRVPPQLMGIVPNNTGGFGSITDAANVFYQNEVVPLQSRMMQVNDWAGEEIINFKDYDLKGAS
ncbi:phage portal protein [Acinetobacter nectaris]|uniref:phage portal protein n=1 Tax=Acinetobacter nectaris TaxID=1219382 RepID=UPI001F1FF40E|nr:phage portal protein [Acinetobacter nectaris]MCF9034728.1 phage portal protein [Acinetobacter nectaris]